MENRRSVLRMPEGLARVARLPELNLLFFAFLLHFPLELWMMGGTLPADPHAVARGEVAKICTIGAASHGAVTVVAYWIVSTAGSSRRWVCAPMLLELVIFTLTGAVLTVLIETGAGVLLEQWAHTGTVVTSGQGGLAFQRFCRASWSRSSPYGW